MLELYHCVDARSFRVLWALEEMGLAYRLHVLPFPPRLFQPDCLEQNTLGTIPLFIDGRATSQSGNTGDGNNGWPWGIVTNATGYGNINVSTATAAQIESGFRQFATQGLSTAL